MATVIAIANQKGGVAKTTTTAALASALKRRGFRVLAIDLDPQGNLSDSVGADSVQAPTVYEVIRREATPQEAIQRLEAFDILPANIMLAAAEQQLPPTGRDQRLRITVGPIRDAYDYILIDTPPSLGILTVNALTFADEVIIPSNAGIFATKGIQQLALTVEEARDFAGSSVRIVGVLLTRFNPRTNISQDIRGLTEDIALSIGVRVFGTHIRSSVVVEEAQANRTDLRAYRHSAGVVEDYERFTQEYLEVTGHDTQADV